ncbi:hypothetical protein GCM10022248_15350 [Nonomuraea soli]
MREDPRSGAGSSDRGPVPVVQQEEPLRPRRSTYGPAWRAAFVIRAAADPTLASMRDSGIRAAASEGGDQASQRYRDVRRPGHPGGKGSILIAAAPGAVDV